MREIGPGTILKNIYGFQNVDNPTAEVVLVLLALWKYSEEGTKDGVINYLKQKAINGMGYEGVRYVEFLRRALDFPRRQMIDPFRPSFQDLLISRGAQACGAKVTLPPEIYLGISTQAHPTYTNLGLAKQRSQSQSKHWTRHRGGSKKSRSLPGHKRKSTSVDDKPLTGTTVETYLDTLPEKKDTVSQHQWPAEEWCYCWNWGKTCKVLNDKGICTKLHICMHWNCRTLHHHSHTVGDHYAREDT